MKPTTRKLFFVFLPITLAFPSLIAKAAVADQSGSASTKKRWKIRKTCVSRLGEACTSGMLCLTRPTILPKTRGRVMSEIIGPMDVSNGIRIHGIPERKLEEGDIFLINRSPGGRSMSHKYQITKIRSKNEFGNIEYLAERIAPRPDSKTETLVVEQKRIGALVHYRVGFSGDRGITDYSLKFDGDSVVDFEAGNTFLTVDGKKRSGGGKLLKKPEKLTMEGLNLPFHRPGDTLLINETSMNWNSRRREFSFVKADRFNAKVVDFRIDRSGQFKLVAEAENKEGATYTLVGKVDLEDGTVEALNAKKTYNLNNSFDTRVEINFD